MEQNISEHIINIYRQEDLIRAFEFDLEKIGAHVINHLPISNIEKLSEVNHYEELIARMKLEGIESSGHLKEANLLVSTLETLHEKLLKSDADYAKIYEDAKSAVDENIRLSENKITSAIQICLNAVYGFLLLRLNGKEIDEKEKSKVEKFGGLLAYLSAKHKEIANSN